MILIRKRPRRSVVIAASAVVIAGVVAGCGSSSSKTAAPSTTTATLSTASGASTSSVPSGASGSGGKSRAGQTIEVELVTTEKGALVIPQFREGAVADEEFVNQHGGVNGAKLKFDICSTDSTPEGSIACANEAIDHHVAVDFVGVDVALDAAVPKLAEAGIPIVMDAPGGAITATNPDVRVYYGSTPADIAGPFKYFLDQGAKSLAIVAPDVPSGHESLPPVASPLAAKLKVPVKIVYLSQTNPDYTAAILELKAAHAAAVFVPATEGECSSLVAAAKTLNFTGALILSGCSLYIQSEAASAAGTYLTSAVYPYSAIGGAPPAIKAQLETYASSMAAAGFESDVTSGESLIGYAGFADLVTALQAIPSGTPVTASSVKAAVDSTKFLGFTGIPMDCSGTNAFKADETACSSSLALLKVVKGGATPTIVPVGTGIFDEGPFLKTVFP